MIDAQNAELVCQGMFMLADQEQTRLLKKQASMAPVVLLNTFENMITPAGLDPSALLARVPEGYEAVLDYVVAQLKPRRSEFSCFLLVFDPMDGAAETTIIARVEHLLGLQRQSNLPMTRKKMFSGPKFHESGLHHVPTQPLLWDDQDRQNYYDLGTWAIGLSGTQVQDHLSVHEPLLEQAKNHIRNHGEYHPFALTLDAAGETTILHSENQNGTDAEEQIDAIAAKIRPIRTGLRAGGIASEVFITNPTTGSRTAAVVIDVELNNGPAVRSYITWEPTPSGQPVFQSLRQAPPNPRIWN